MVSTRDINRESRRSRLIELCVVQHSIRELAEKIGTSYATVRRDVFELINDGHIYATGATNERGEVLYASGGKRPMPEFHLTGMKTDLMSQGLIFGNHPEPEKSKGINAVQLVRQIMLELLHAATAYDRDQKPDPKQLMAWKSEAGKARMAINNAVELADALLKADVWTPESLLRIRGDASWDAAAIEDAYANFLTYLEAEAAKSKE